MRVVSEHSVMSDESTPAAHRLAKLVKQASAANTSLDVPGILWLEHINLQVGDRAKANAFYGEFLGFTRDPSPSWHYNLGSQQFHLQDGTTHVIHGSIGTPCARSTRCAAAETPLLRRWPARALPSPTTPRR